MIFLVWTWLLTAIATLIFASLAVGGVRKWWSKSYMRPLVIVLCGLSAGAIVDLYLTARSFNADARVLARPLGDPSLIFAELLTISRLFVQLPAIYFAMQMARIFSVRHLMDEARRDAQQPQQEGIK